MLDTRWLVFIAVGALIMASCFDQEAPQDVQGQKATPDVQERKAPQVVQGEGPCEGKKDGDCGDHKKEKEGEGCDHDTPHAKEATKLPDGKGFHGGKPLGSSPNVSVAELLSVPDKYTGKVVRFKGDISAMCHHKRSWFAVAADDKSGRQLRVITAPAFLVPPESIGRSADVEGTVEVVELKAKFARHLDKEHKLGAEPKGDAPVKQVVIRVAGADFFDAPAK